MKASTDIIIVGGGIIACSIAFQLSKRGKKVVVIEKDTIASKASRAAAGMLGLEMEVAFQQSPSLFHLAQKSRDMFPDLHAELKELTGINTEYVANGFLKIASDDISLSHLQQERAYHESNNIKSTLLGAEEIKRLEPELSDAAQGALYVAQGANVSARKLTQAFADAAAKLGAKFLENTKVSDLITNQAEVKGVRTAGKDYYAEEVIVAAGAWSQLLLEKKGIQLETYPVKGECFSVQVNRQIITRTIYTKNCYIVPKLGGKLIIGATEVPHTFSEGVKLGSLSELIQKATTLLPILNEMEINDIWSGVRPNTLSGNPYVERNTFYKNLTIATGHYRNGVLLAPVTGVFVADLLEEKVKRLASVVNKE